MVTRAPRDIVKAAAVAAVLSGAPSTMWTLARRGDLLASTRAAGTMAGGRPSIVRGVAVHSVLSLGWTVVLDRVIGARRHTIVIGAVAGAAIAALDVGVVAPRRFAAVAALPRGPLVADHIAFGGLVGWMLSR